MESKSRWVERRCSIRSVVELSRGQLWGEGGAEFGAWARLRHTLAFTHDRALSSRGSPHPYVNTFHTA